MFNLEFDFLLPQTEKHSSSGYEDLFCPTHLYAWCHSPSSPTSCWLSAVIHSPCMVTGWNWLFGINQGTMVHYKFLVYFCWNLLRIVTQACKSGWKHSMQIQSLHLHPSWPIPRHPTVPCMAGSWHLVVHSQEPHRPESGPLKELTLWWEANQVCRSRVMKRPRQGQVGIWV